MQQFCEQKSANNKFHEQNQFHEEKNQCTTFIKGKINTQQVSQPKNNHTASFTNKKSAHNQFHGQNRFHEKKNKCKSFTKRKINLQQVSRTKIRTQQVPRTNVSP